MFPINSGALAPRPMSTRKRSVNRVQKEGNRVHTILLTCYITHRCSQHAAWTVKTPPSIPCTHHPSWMPTQQHQHRGRRRLEHTPTPRPRRTTGNMGAPHHASTGAEQNVGSCTCRHINTSRNTASRGTYLLCRRVSGMLTFFTEPRPASSTPGAQLPFDSGWDTRHRRGEKASAYARGQPRYDSYQGRHTYL